LRRQLRSGKSDQENVMSKIAKACRLQKRNQFNILRDRTQTSGARRRQQHGSPLIEAGEYERMSLAELFIKQPTKFLKEYVDHDGDSDPVIVAADKMIMDLHFIKVPDRFEGRAKVVQSYRPGKPFRLEIVPIDKLICEHSSPHGWFSVCDWIDLMNPYYIGLGASGMKSVVQQFMDAIDGVKNSTWSRTKCEQFFSEKHNFIPKHERNWGLYLFR